MNTMPRCATPLIPALAALCIALPAAAQQVVRPFPANALRGVLEVTQAPDILLNDKPARLAPGSRIRGEDNLIHVPGSVAGRKLVVHYTADLMGQVHDVWILKPDEMARKPWPTTPDEARSWRYNPDARVWTKP
jgi:hypothetical protein